MWIVWIALGLIVGAEYNEFIRPLTKRFLPWISREGRRERANRRDSDS
jgi:hypothetical protein